MLHICRWIQTAISYLPWWNFTICLMYKIYFLEFWIHMIIFTLRPCTNQQILQKIEAHILLLNWAVSCGGGVGQVDRCSKTLYCACVLYVTLPSQRARAIIPQTAIFDEFSTLLFSAVTKPTPVIFHRFLLNLRGFSIPKIINMGPAVLEKFA